MMKDQNECVIECMTPYSANTETLNCDLHIAKDFFTPLVIVILILIGIALVILVLSKIVSCIRK